MLAAGLAGLAHAQTTVNFPDATGEVAVPGNPYPHIDIASVDVTLDQAGENLTFTINLDGDPVATNWGKYMIAIRSGPGGATSGNGWNRPINFSTGMTHWIGCWADGVPAVGGLNVWSYNGTNWNEIKATYDAVDPLALPVITTSSFSVTVPVSLIGYTPGPGQVFTFDVYTSGGGGGDGAADALSVSTTSINNWGDTFNTIAPLSFPNDALDPNGDEDGDGYLNGQEVAGSSTLGYISNPFIPNYADMNVAGSFNGYSTSEGVMLQGDTSSLVTQYHWTHERRFAIPATAIEFKFTTGDSFDINWGQGSGTGVVARNGSNISGFVGASGIYRFFFDQGALTQTFTRRTFDNLAGFLAAYGIDPQAPGYDEDSDDDGLQDGDEFTANTDPLNNDTDGDGILDNVDAQPLTQLRDVTFSVNMSVQIAKGNFDPDGGYDVKLLVFTGDSQNYLDPYTTGGFVMEDPDLDGIYTVTLTAVPGFETQSFGQYKFFHTTPNAPNSGYEEGFDRNFALGEPELEQVLATVFFSNDEGTPAGGYADWADANAGGGPFDGDFDQDGVKNGVEYFYGETGSSFTLNPAPVNGVITWPRGPNATGVTFKVWQSETLADPWEDVTAAADLSVPGFVKYTLPSGPTAPSKLFVRFEVLQDGPQ